jgi:hypothetical protein
MMQTVKRLADAYDERRSAVGRVFRRNVVQWLADDGELLVMKRLTRAAGRKDWFLIHTLDDLDTIVSRSRPADCLTVFSGPQLTHRGAADEDAIAAALAVVGRNEESVFGEVVAGDPELADAFAAVPGDEEWVEDWIRERWQRNIAFGPYPPFLSNDPAVAIDGIVPDEDGSITPGVY